VIYFSAVEFFLYRHMLLSRGIITSVIFSVSILLHGKLLELHIEACAKMYIKRLKWPRNGSHFVADTKDTRLHSRRERAEPFKANCPKISHAGNSRWYLSRRYFRDFYSSENRLVTWPFARHFERAWHSRPTARHYLLAN